MEQSPETELLCVLVKAHETAGDDGSREAIDFFRYSGGQHMQHHALPVALPAFDETMLEDLRDQGLLDVDYRESNWRLTPTLEGRRLVAQLKAIRSPEPLADLAGFVAAIGRQAQSPNKLAWPAVRPVLAGMRRYWEDGGFPAEVSVYCRC